MKRFNFFKIVKRALTKLISKKEISDEVVETQDTDPGTGLDPIDNTDPQNPNYPPKK